MSKFQDDLHAKINLQNKKQTEISEIEEEMTILKYTESTLRNVFNETIKELKKYELKYGVTGLLTIEADIEEFTRKKGNFDFIKGKTLEELTAIIDNLKSKIEEKRDLLKPLIEDHKNLKALIKETEEEHKTKKSDYEKTISDSKESFETAIKEYKNVFEPYSKINLNKTLVQEKIKVQQGFKNLLEQEAKYHQGIGTFSKEDKTFRDYLSVEITEKEKNIQVLKEKREEIKELNSNVVEQNKMLNDIKNLLDENLKCRMRMNTNATSSFKTIREQYNRVVME